MSDEAHRERLRALLQEGLQTDGEHHKQWFLEEIAAELGFDPLKLRDFAPKGIAP